jgi:hypothetical protein
MLVNTEYLALHPSEYCPTSDRTMEPNARVSLVYLSDVKGETLICNEEIDAKIIRREIPRNPRKKILFFLRTDELSREYP